MIMLSRSINNIKKCKVKDRCFILANGPSLNNHDLSLLANEDVISINASPLALTAYKIESKFYCVSDPRFLLDEKKREIFLTQLNSANTNILVRDTVKAYLKNELKITKNLDKVFAIPSLGRDGFSKNLLRGFFFGCSTTHLALQLAYFLNYSKVYLLGLDLNYGFDDYRRFYTEQVVQEYDLLVSVQLSNYQLANNIFYSENKEVYICNKKSWAAPYIPYAEYINLF